MDIYSLFIKYRTILDISICQIPNATSFHLEFYSSSQWLWIEQETSFLFDIIWPNTLWFSEFCLFIDLFICCFCFLSLCVTMSIWWFDRIWEKNLTNECSMSTWVIFCSSPWDHWHHGMMIQVQKWNLSVFFTQHKEYGVQKFRDFCQKVEIYTTCLLFLGKNTQI